MLTFLRGIRRSLIESGTARKYLLYSIGEILLVVIGILLAIQINSWYQKKLEYEKTKNNLYNLKEDLINNIKVIQNLDSLYAKRFAETEQGLAIFHNNPGVNDFLKIDSLVGTTYGSFKVIRSSYDEMLNEGSFYGIRNRVLRNEINEFYVEAGNAQQAFLDINREGLDLNGHPSLHRYDLLIYYLKNSPEKLKGIDTSWYNNPGSPTYLAFMKRGIYFQNESNSARRGIIARFVRRAESLIESLDQELQTVEPS